MRVVLIVVVIIVVIFSKIERRRVWRQGNSSLTLYSVLPAEVSCSTVHMVLKMPHQATRNPEIKFTKVLCKKNLRLRHYHVKLPRVFVQ